MPRWLLYASMVALSLLAHLKGISAPLLDYHYHRQANTAAIARNFHEYSLPPWAPRVDWEGGGTERAATELPLYMWLVGLLWPLWGLGELWGRLLSAASSALTAVVLFAFLEKRGKAGWLRTEEAFGAALFFSVLPVEVYFGRTVQPEAFALLATVCSLWALDRWYAARGRRAAAWWVFCVLSATIAIGHKLPYLYLLGVLACLALARRGWKAVNDARLWAVPIATLALVYAWYRFASTGLYVVPTTQDGALVKAILSYERLPYFAFFQLFSRLPELALTYPGILFFGFGARELLLRRKLWFFGGWWLCVLVDVLAGGGYAHHHDYTALPWAPVNAAFIGAGFFSLWQRKLPAWGRAGLVALALGMPLHASLRIRHWYEWNYPHVLTLKPAIDAFSEPGELFLCNQRASSLFLFYIGRRGWSWDLAELGPAGLPKVEQVIAQGARFLLTEKQGIFLDKKDPTAGWFYRRFPIAHDDGRFLVFRLEARP